MQGKIFILFLCAALVTPCLFAESGASLAPRSFSSTPAAATPAEVHRITLDEATQKIHVLGRTQLVPPDRYRRDTSSLYTKGVSSCSAVVLMNRAPSHEVFLGHFYYGSVIRACRFRLQSSDENSSVISFFQPSDFTVLNAFREMQEKIQTPQNWDVYFFGFGVHPSFKEAPIDDLTLLFSRMGFTHIHDHTLSSLYQMIPILIVDGESRSIDYVVQDWSDTFSSRPSEQSA